MCSRVYLLDSGETVGIYSDVEHEVLKTMLKPWPIWKSFMVANSSFTLSIYVDREKLIGRNL